MPITIVTPVEGGPFGPGMQLNVFTDLDHNTVTDGRWKITQLLAPQFELPVIEWDYPFSGSTLTQPLGRDTNGQWRFPLPQEGTTQGQPGKIQIQVVDGNNISLQQQVVGFTNDNQTSVPYIVTTQPQVQGGFTATDRSTLNAVIDAVAGTLLSSESGGIPIASTLWELISCPRDSMLCRREGFPVNGRQTLTRPGALGPVSAYGASLDFSILPAQLGVTDGVVDLAQERLCQLSVIRISSCGDEFISEVMNVHERHVDFRWCDPLTINRIEIDVLPGVTCGWTWLSLLGA